MVPALTGLLFEGAIECTQCNISATLSNLPNKKSSDYRCVY